jgi:YVTN family beta-propeller protein
MGGHRSIVAFTRAALATCLLWAASIAAAPAHELVYVQATMTKNVYVIDAQSYRTLTAIPLGDYTYDVVGSPDGKVAYVASQISAGSPLGWQVNEAGKVVAISTATDTPLWETAIDGSPHHMAMDPGGRCVYLAVFNRNYLYVLDAKSGTILHRWYSTLGNHGVIVSKDGKRLYVGNMQNDSIWVYDTDTGRVVDIMRAGEAVRPLVLDPDETHLVYQLSRFHGFKVRDLKSGAIASIDLPALPAGTQMPEAYPFTVNHGLAVTPDGTKLLAAGSVAGYVAVYSLPGYRLLGTIKVGDDPNWIVVRADSKVAFVTNRGSGTLSVLDLANLEELKQIPVGKMPQRLSLIDVAQRH